jgi:hypothetical protein
MPNVWSKDKCWPGINFQAYLMDKALKKLFVKNSASFGPWNFFSKLMPLGNGHRGFLEKHISMHNMYGKG